MLMVLISWPTSEVSLAQRIWAQLSLDSWVRLAGCSRWGGSSNPYLAGAIGFRIDAWNEDPLDVDNNPFAQPDEDWMGWLPYFHYRPVGADLRSEITWNAQASPYAVDIKAQRKLEELNQTLWMFFTPPGEGVITYNWDLSIGLKLP